MQYSCPVQDPVSAATTGVIPVELFPAELDIEGLYESPSRRRGDNQSGKVIPAHVHSRRRAQNRASQRAFRERKEKLRKEMEDKLIDLQGRHSELARSYMTLEFEYSVVKQELETIRSKYENVCPFPRNHIVNIEEWDAPRANISGPLLIGVSKFYYELEEGREQKG
ncbi:hypothetical protein OIDMADRAFT_111681 [Oidiodendron maius Zn]|uniref:Putative transcription factor kapC n=1 Tax=Oidiodendron maius (strain Zn) TaxID=913774 RepID=A0A0C3DCR2_OIDMZ|nr:hypothetical protein OIDMADRAFT_111681 [Oidiodendron maius Zn]